MSIAMTPVTSSNIKSIGYEGGTLAVLFTNGKEFRYPDVPAETYEAFKAADADPDASVGSYFAKHIRPHFKGIPQPEAKKA